MLELDKDKLLSLLKENKEKLKNFHVSKLGIFGSFIRGENTKESDIDFLVEFEKGEKNFNNFINLAFFLENLLNRKIDLLTIESLSPYMKSEILKEVYFEKIE
ncbi:MAG: nucleotidyltransferase family protein [Promethearchaeati archaeon]